MPAAGTWSRDCELISLTYDRELKLNYHKDEDDTYWSFRSNVIVAFRVLSEEFSRSSYLLDLPTDGAFFEILDSPWIAELADRKAEVLSKFMHYVLRFYDETIEIIAQKSFFEKLDTKPNRITSAK